MIFAHNIKKYNNNPMFSKVYTQLSLSSIILWIVNAVSDNDETMEQHKRPFLVSDIRIGNVKLPISPITVIIFSISAIVLYRGLTKASSAVASHILLEGTTDDVKDKLTKMKSEIKNDAKKFAEYAAKYSKCPSGKNGNPPGSLGKFKMGMMVPSFDKAVFSPKNEIGEVIGPVMTPFGFHLIMIHERDEQRQLILE